MEITALGSNLDGMLKGTYSGMVRGKGFSLSEAR
jgi:hypothetical protein